MMMLLNDPQVLISGVIYRKDNRWFRDMPTVGEKPRVSPRNLKLRFFAKVLKPNLIYSVQTKQAFV